MTENEQEYDQIIANCTETLDASPGDVSLTQQLLKWIERIDNPLVNVTAVGSCSILTAELRIPVGV